MVQKFTWAQKRFRLQKSFWPKNLVMAQKLIYIPFWANIQFKLKNLFWPKNILILKTNFGSTTTFRQKILLGQKLIFGTNHTKWFNSKPKLKFRMSKIVRQGSWLHVVLKLIFGIAPHVDQKSWVIGLHHSRVDFIFLCVSNKAVSSCQDPRLSDERSTAKMVKRRVVDKRPSERRHYRVTISVRQIDLWY